MKTITTSQGEFVFIPKSQPFRIDFKEPFKAIGYCSEIIKDEELAKMVVDGGFCSSNGMILYAGYNYLDSDCFLKATDSFKSLLQVNDIWLENPLGETAEHGQNEEDFWDLAVNQQEAQAKVQDWFVVKKL